MDVIATPCGGHDELVADGIIGYVFDRHVKQLRNWSKDLDEESILIAIDDCS